MKWKVNVAAFTEAKEKFKGIKALSTNTMLNSV